MKRGIRLWVAAAVTVGAMTSMAPAHADTSSATVTLTLTDSLGHPSVDDCVALDVPPGSTSTQAVQYAYTDSSGVAAVSAIPGQYVVAAHVCSGADPALASRYVGSDDRVSTATVETIPSGATDLGTLILPATGTIEGTVIDDQGNPNPDACVEAVDGTETSLVRLGRSAQAGSDGTYTLSGLYPRAHDLAFEDCQNTTPASFYDHVTSATQATPVNLPPAGTVTGINGVVPRAATIAGTIHDDHGNPVSGNGICLQDDNTGGAEGSHFTINSDGSFLIDHVRPGTVTLSAITCLYQGSTKPNYIDSPAVTFSVAAGEQVTGKNFVMPVGGEITGTVVDAAGKPIVGACVGRETGDPDSVTTASDGSYALTGLDTSQSRVVVTDCVNNALATTYWPHAFFTSDAGIIAVTRGQSSSGINVVLDTPAATITGQVTDPSGNGVYTCVTLTSTLLDISCIGTDATGHFAFHGLPQTSGLSITAEPFGNYLAGRTSGISTTTGQTTTAHVVMQLAGAITGTVVDQRGLPILGVSATATCVNSSGATSTVKAVTDSRGVYALTGVTPGNCTIAFADNDGQLPFTGWYGYPLPPITVAVASGQTVHLLPQLVITITVPSIPTAVSAVAGDASALVGWLPPADDGHAQVTSYLVLDASGHQVGQAGGSSRQLVVGGLRDGQTYSLTVVAMNSKGASPRSLAVRVSPRRGLPSAASLLEPTLSIRVIKRGRRARLGLVDATALRGRRLALQSLHGKKWVTVKTLTEQTSSRWSVTLTELIPRSESKVRLGVLVGSRTPTVSRAVRAV